MKREAKQEKAQAVRTAKMVQIRGKPIYLECPRHKTPYSVEVSRDPVNEGSWRYYFCEKCRQERAEGRKNEPCTRN